MADPTRIQSPLDPALERLCRDLAARAEATDASGQWPREQLRLCGEAGVFRWFVPRAWGGDEWSEPELVQGYLRLSAACLTTTFIITQRTGACQRIAASENQRLKERWLPPLAAGEAFATVAVSHLTTSRRHLAQNVLRARETAEGFVLDGYSPWVTGGNQAQLIVTGATLDDGRQILVALDTSLPGVKAVEPPKLVALAASQTGEVHCHEVLVDREDLLAGPAEKVMQIKPGAGARTGGLQTSTLALGLAGRAIEYLEADARQRDDLAEPADSLRREHVALVSQLTALAAGTAACSTEELRARANSLVLRATQAALGGAKGAGFIARHPTGRWCREALFFLVWSCPQPVLSANLCELAGLS